MINEYDTGYDDYFEAVPYNDKGHTAEWHRGWAAAERYSRCGWFLRDGKPNRERNKQYA